jgi:hypothetical protein
MPRLRCSATFLKRLDALVRGQQEQIPVLMKIDRLANFISELFQEPDRFDGETDVGRIRELVAHAAGVASGRPGSQQLLALDQHEIGDALARQMVGHARAHAAASDDDGVGGAFHHAARCSRRSTQNPQNKFHARPSAGPASSALIVVFPAITGTEPLCPSLKRRVRPAP